VAINGIIVPVNSNFKCELMEISSEIEVVGNNITQGLFRCLAIGRQKSN